MNRTNSKIGWVSAVAAVALFTGCVVHEPRHHVRVHAPAPVVHVQSGIVVHDTYTYYPGYQVYYSSSSRQCIYLDGGSWVTRAAPPRISIDVLLASPSIRMDFHDAPSLHHASISKTYPTSWTPPGHSKGNKVAYTDAHEPARKQSFKEEKENHNEGRDAKEDNKGNKGNNGNKENHGSGKKGKK
jgi:hypothetical protein